MNSSFLLILSLVLFAVGIFFYRKTNLLKINRALFSLLIFSSICLNVAYAVSDYFTENGIDNSVVYHVKYGLGGAGFSEYWGLISSSVFFIILALALSFWTFTAKAKESSGRKKYIYAAFIPALISPLISPATFDLYNIFLTQRTEAVDESEFYKYYKKPAIRRAGESKNLVFIYAESLEQAYFDNELFPGLMKELHDIELTATYFTDVSEVMGTGWTVGAMVGSQCGIPLVTPSHGNSMSGMDKFLPSAVCLSDLLKKKGYYLTYFGGADLDFAGKGKFFATHKFDEVMGREELLPRLKYQNYRSGWGLFDDTLFSMIYKRFLELSENEKRFALFTLTLDTHQPNGYPSPIGCKDIAYKDGSNPILNAVACSDHLIADLIKKIFESPNGSNTVVVVASDTLSMRNPAYDQLKKGKRRNLFMIFESGSKKERIIDKAGSTLDVGTTLLPFIGYKGEIGLGRDLMLEGSDFDEIVGRLQSWRPNIANFWNFPKVRNNIEINLSKKIIDIDGRTFKAPVLVELNEDLETTLMFEFDKSPVHKTLIDHVRSLDRGKAFLLVDFCENVSKLDKSFGTFGPCMVVGKDGKYWNIGRIIPPDADALVNYEQVYRLNSDDIRYFSGFNSPLEFEAQRIAHAGGGVSGKTYTNSYDALNKNIKKGFNYFELDFSFTSDGHLVCIHDWEGSFKRSFGFSTKAKPTLKEFQTLVKNKSEFQKCTLDGLIAWIKENPTATIVTDVKENNIKALEVIAKKVPDFRKRIIPQIYNPSNYDLVQKMGFEQIIWTLYRYNGSNKEVLKWVDRFKGPFAITMPIGRAVTTLPSLLARKHIPTYVHTINSEEEKDKFLTEFSLMNVYTDFLNP